MATGGAPTWIAEAGKLFSGEVEAVMGGARSPRGRRRRQAPRGLTLIELAVAVLVLSLGTLAVVRAGDQSRKVIGGAVPRLLALEAARNRAGELRLLGLGAVLPEETSLGGRVITLEQALLPTSGGLVRAEITARTQGGPGASLIAVVAP